jgi:RHS repeat-associated protein
LDFFLARYYSSVQGRFTSPDEFTGGPDELFSFVDDASSNPTFYADLTNPQSLNKYQFTYNNPLRYVDPDGHEPEPSPDPDPCCTQEQLDNIKAAAATGAAGGGAIGAVVGAGVGGTGGAIAGAGSGTVVLPGPGTIGGGILGAGAGGTVGAGKGALIGAGIGATILGGGLATYYYAKDYLFPPAPVPQPNTQAQPQAPPAPVAMPRPIDKPADQGHKKKGKGDHNKHTRVRPGDKQPPNYTPFRKPPKKPPKPEPTPMINKGPKKKDD